MSETGIPYDGRSGTAGTGTGSTDVKDRVKETSAHAADAGRNLAHDAKVKARDVAHEASEQAHDFLDRTRTELGYQAQSQQQRLARGLHSVEEELGQMAGAATDPGYVTELARQAGDVTGQAARWLESREPGAILDEIEDFARRRPGMFIALAAGAGVLVGRFLRGVRDADRTQGDTSAPSGVTPADGTDAPGARTVAPTRLPADPAPTTPVVPEAVPTQEPPYPSSAEGSTWPEPPSVPPTTPRRTEPGGDLHG